MKRTGTTVRVLKICIPESWDKQTTDFRYTEAVVWCKSAVSC